MTTKSFVRGALLAAVSTAALTSAVTAATITGRVTEAGEGVALKGAIVSIDSLNTSRQTESDGTFRFQGLPAGTYELRVSYVGAEDETVTVNVAEDETATTSIVLGEAGVLTMDNILVIGQRGSLNKSLSQQKAADNLISVLSADAIGQFPDQNVSEAARRVSGLSVELDQGEGRYVVIRGINPNLNATSVNGVRLPAPEGGTRQVALDVIDADVLSSIEVTKSLTPDLDGDGIGGSIEIKTASAFDRDGLFIKGKIAGTVAEKVDEITPNVAISASNTFLNDRLGIAGSVSFRERKFATDNIEAAFTSEGDIFYPEELEFRDYVVTRERFNASLNLDYKATESTDLYLRSLFSEFSDQEDRTRIVIKAEEAEFDAANSSALTQTASLIASGGDNIIEFERESKDRLEEQIIYSIVAGGETVVNAFTIEYSASYSHAEEKEPNRIDTLFISELNSGESITFNAADPLFPQLGAGFSSGAFNSAENYDFAESEFLNGFTEDDEIAFQADVQYDTFFRGYAAYVKGGLKARLREKNRDVNVILFDGYEPGDLTLADFETTVDYPFIDFGPAPDHSTVRNFITQNGQDLTISDSDSEEKSTEEDYESEENIYAGYVMGRIDIEKLRLVGGVRVEYTEFDATGSGVFGDGFGTASGSTDYTDILPSINARYEVTDNIITRASYYRSLGRPEIEQAVPAINIAESSSTGGPGGIPEFEGSIGNPELDRQIADNLDASVDWYFTDNAVISLGVFYKNIQDFIAEQEVEDTFFAGLFFSEADTFLNLDEAELFGIEFNYQHAFESIDGLILGFNYTYVDGEADFEGETTVLPKQSENIMNIVLGYDKGRLDLRAAATYRDEYLDELGGRTVDEYFQIDLSAKVQITDNLQFFAEAVNVNDETFVAFERDGGRNLLSQFEEYGYTLNAGINFKF